MRTDRPSVLHLHFWAGSVEKVISAFASNGRRYRHMIACCPADRTVRAPFEHMGVPIHPEHESRIANHIFNKMLRLWAFTYGDMVRTINRLRPDVLHIHNRQEIVAPLIQRLAYKPAVLVHYHRHFAQPTIPAGADRLIFISQRTADDILGKTGSRLPYDIVFNHLSQQVLARAKDVSSLTNGLSRALSLLSDSAATMALLDRAVERAGVFATDPLVVKLEAAYDAARMDS